MLTKINAAIHKMPLCFRCWCSPCVSCLSARSPNWRTPQGAFRHVVGSIVYGVLFIPFVFALLQQSAMDRSAVDPFRREETLSGRSWLSAFVFLFAVWLYVLIAFTALPETWYQPGEIRLAIVLTAVMLVVWIQQALTYQYILRRPDLDLKRFKEVLKRDRRDRSHLFKVCGGAYSSLNPGNLVNYIYLSVILSEFFVLGSVCFHQQIPWRTSGSRCVDEPPAV